MELRPGQTRELATFLEEWRTPSYELDLANLLLKGSEKPPRGLKRGSVAVVLRSEDPSAYTAGHLLAELDREFRRAAAVFREGPVLLGAAEYEKRPDRKTPRLPYPVRDRALELFSAYQESPLDLLLTAYDAVRDLLLSQPLQLAITISWLWDHRPHLWGLKRSEPEELEEIVKELSKTARAAARREQPSHWEVIHEPDGRIRARWDSEGPRRRQRRRQS
jgi:hypothetical protein